MIWGCFEETKWKQSIHDHKYWRSVTVTVKTLQVIVLHEGQEIIRKFIWYQKD